MPAAVRFSTMVVVPAIPGLLSMPATAGRTATATPASLPHRFCSPLVVTASIMVRGRPGRASPPVSIWAPATVPAPAPASFTTVSIVLPTAALAGCSGVASGWRGPRGSWTDCARWGRLLQPFKPCQLVLHCQQHDCMKRLRVPCQNTFVDGR